MSATPDHSDQPAPPATASLASAPQGATHRRFWSSVAHGLRRFAKGTFVLLCVCAVVAVGILVVASSVDVIGAGSMSINDESVRLGDVFTRGVGAVVLAWFALTGGLMIALLAVVFAFVVTALALGGAAAAVAMVGLVLAAPALMLLGVLVWLGRKLFGQTSAPTVA